MLRDNWTPTMEPRSKKEGALSYTWMKPRHIYNSIILLETKYTIHFFLNTSMAYNSEALYDMYMYVCMYKLSQKRIYTLTHYNFSFFFFIYVSLITGIRGIY